MALDHLKDLDSQSVTWPWVRPALFLVPLASILRVAFDRAWKLGERTPGEVLITPEGGFSQGDHERLIHYEWR